MCLLHCSDYFTSQSLLISYFPSSRFFFGKNKVMTIALGREKEAEYRENLHKIASVSVNFMYISYDRTTIAT